MAIKLILLLILQSFLPVYCQGTTSLEQNDDGKIFRMTINKTSYNFGAQIPVKLEIINHSNEPFLINDTSEIKESVRFFEKPTSVRIFFNSESSQSGILVGSGKTIFIDILIDTKNLKLDKKYSEIPLSMKISYFTFVNGSRSQVEENPVNLSSLNFIVKKE